MNNKPVAWMVKNRDSGIGYVQTDEPIRMDKVANEYLPLYTHPANLTEDTECQYCKQGCIRCDARKTLTDEEINKLWAESHEDGIAMQQGFTTQQHYFAHLILRKAN